jgi:hypothetical protein
MGEEAAAVRGGREGGGRSGNSCHASGQVDNLGDDGEGTATGAKLILLFPLACSLFRPKCRRLFLLRGTRTPGRAYSATLRAEDLSSSFK